MCSPLTIPNNIDRPRLVNLQDKNGHNIVNIRQFRHETRSSGSRKPQDHNWGGCLPAGIHATIMGEPVLQEGARPQNQRAQSRPMLFPSMADNLYVTDDDCHLLDGMTFPVVAADCNSLVNSSTHNFTTPTGLFSRGFYFPLPRVRNKKSSYFRYRPIFLTSPPSPWLPVGSRNSSTWVSLPAFNNSR